MRKRTVKLWRLTEDGRKLSAGTIEAADPARHQVVGVSGHRRARGLLRHLSRCRRIYALHTR